jgi:hypothetical protein
VPRMRHGVARRRHMKPTALQPDRGERAAPGLS